MLLSKNVEVKWNTKTKNHYVSKGYNYTKMGDYFSVSVLDLTSGSNVDVLIKCDYCGITYKKIWYRYIRERAEIIDKDCCNKCKKIKIKESVMQKYGVENVFCLESVKNKIETTNLEKYGVANPFADETVKRKICETNTKKYGYSSPMKNEHIKEKAQQTCLRKYGVKSYAMIMDLKGENHPMWKGGVKYHRQERSTIEYATWRRNVFAKDHYTCRCCLNKSGNGKTITLNAHHILNWKDNPSERYSLDNGITLCSECHNRFHSLYGKNNNNKFQLNEYLDNYGKKIC